MSNGASSDSPLLPHVHALATSRAAGGRCRVPLPCGRSLLQAEMDQPGTGRRQPRRGALTHQLRNKLLDAVYARLALRRVYALDALPLAHVLDLHERGSAQPYCNGTRTDFPPSIRLPHISSRALAACESCGATRGVHDRQRQQHASPCNNG